MLKRLLLPLKILGLLAVVALIPALISLRPQPAGLNVNSSPASQVFIDDQESGGTPLVISRRAAPIKLKLIATTGAVWETQLKLNPGTETVVRREFGPSEAESAGEVFGLEKGFRDKAILSLTSTPDAVTVKIDGETYGFTPLVLETLPEGDHELLFTSPGYKDRLVSVKTIKGLRLNLFVQLARDFIPEPIANPSTSPTGPLSPTPTPTPPKASITQALSIKKPYIEVNSASVGFVNVRSEPSTAAEILAQLDHKEKAPYKSTSSDGGWYEVEFETGKTGWISSAYATLFE